MLNNLKNKKKKKGFTIIELIIVMSIIAILAAIAIPKFGDIRNKANISADIATAKNIYTVINAEIQEKNSNKDDYGDDEIKKIIGDDINSKLDSSSEFKVAVANGEVIVRIGDSQVYPKPVDPSGNNWYPAR